MSIIRILIFLSIFISIYSDSFSFKSFFAELKRFPYQEFVQNPYRILRLPPWTSMEKIRKKHKELAKKYHPDKSEGNREKFELIHQAFEKIKKERKEMEENENLSFSSVVKGTISKVLNIEVLFVAAYSISYITFKFQSLIYFPLFYMIISFTIIDNLFAHFFSEEIIEYIACIIAGWFLYTQHKNMEIIGNLYVFKIIS